MCCPGESGSPRRVAGQAYPCPRFAPAAQPLRAGPVRLSRAKAPLPARPRPGHQLPWGSQRELARIPRAPPRPAPAAGASVEAGPPRPVPARPVPALPAPPSRARRHGAGGGAGRGSLGPPLPAGPTQLRLARPAPPPGDPQGSALPCPALPPLPSAAPWTPERLPGSHA